MAGKKTRIMYVELKSGHHDDGPARIGRVSFSQTGRTIYYQGKTFLSIGGAGIGANYLDLSTREEYWISGPKRNGADRHACGKGAIEIDDDAMKEYWRDIRGCEPPQNPFKT